MQQLIKWAHAIKKMTYCCCCCCWLCHRKHCCRSSTRMSACTAAHTHLYSRQPKSVCKPSSLLMSSLLKVSPGIRPRFLSQKMEQKLPLKKMPSIAAYATRRSAKLPELQFAKQQTGRCQTNQALHACVTCSSCQQPAPCLEWCSPLVRSSWRCCNVFEDCQCFSMHVLSW